MSQIIKLDRCRVDTIVSRSHYIISTVVLGVFALTLISTNIAYESISCFSRFHTTSDITQPQLNSFCYAPQTTSDTYSEETIPHQIPAFYRYQPIIFFLISLSFYWPKYVWSCMENNLIEKCVQNLNQPIQKSAERISELRLLAQYIQRNKASHKLFACYYFCSDVMYFINLVIQVAVLDHVLNGRFIPYGLKMNLDEVFPKSFLCKYSYQSQSMEATCLLHANFLTDKFVLLIWYWWLILAFLTACQLGYHLAFITSSKFRRQIFYMKAGKLVRQDYLTRIICDLSYGDKISETLFLIMIVQNLQNDTSADLLELLC